MTLKSSSIAVINRTASPTARGTHYAEAAFRAVQVTLVTWLAQHPTLVMVQERLQTDMCLLNHRTQSRVDLCCCSKWLESHRTSLSRKCCLFWAGKRKNNPPCTSKQTLGKTPKPLNTLLFGQNGAMAPHSCFHC